MLNSFALVHNSPQVACGKSNSTICSWNCSSSVVSKVILLCCKEQLKTLLQLNIIIYTKSLNMRNLMPFLFQIQLSKLFVYKELLNFESRIKFHYERVRRTSSHSPGLPSTLSQFFSFYFPFIHLHFALWNTSARLSLVFSHPFLSP